jgi:hypothetical protein
MEIGPERLKTLQEYLDVVDGEASDVKDSKGGG